jgi:hypothetical protein
VCHSELHLAAGGFSNETWPVCGGHEGAGVVAAGALDATTLRVDCEALGITVRTGIRATALRATGWNRGETAELFGRFFLHHWGADLPRRELLREAAPSATTGVFRGTASGL